MFWKTFRDKAEGLSDLLRYAASIDDGVVMGKGGELIGGFLYLGTDTESSSVMELNAISARLNAVLASFGNGWMVHCDVVRTESLGYPNLGAFPDVVSKVIDEERRQHYNSEDGHFQSAYALIFTYLTPSLLESKGREWLFESSDDVNVVNKKTLSTKAVEKFQAAMSDVESALSSVFQGVTRLKCVTHKTMKNGIADTWTEDRLISYLHYAVTGISQRIRLPEVPMYIDTIIGSQDFWGGVIPRIGKKHIQIINIEGFPAESFPGILDNLNRLPITYRFSTRFIFLDPEEAKGILNKLRKKWRQKATPLSDQIFNTSNGAVDLDALQMQVDAENAMSEAGALTVRFGHYTSVVVLMEENIEKLKLNTTLTVKAIRDMGFAARLEDINAIEGYFGSLPGEGVANVRKPILHSLNLAHLLPTTSFWAGAEKNPCPFYKEDNAPLLYGRGAGSTPFRLSLHISDVGHTLILGPTGSGKSTLLNLIIAQHRRYKGAQIFGFDKGMSAFIPVKAMGGTHYEVGGDNSSLAFCPLSQVDKLSERAWAEEWVEILLTLNGVVVGPRQRSVIQDALLSIGEADADLRTLTHFQAALQDEELRNALSPYVGQGSAAHLLDAETDSLSLGNFQVFEMENLMNMGEKNLIPVLLYLFHRIEQQLDGSPTLLVLDEAWLMLSHPLFMEKIREWLKVLRKANTAVIFATQSIEDIVNSPIAPVIFQSCPSKILLPNPEARNEVSAKAYTAMGLSERQLELITMGTPKRDYYYLSTVGRRLFSLDLGKVALAFVGRSGKEDIKLARELIDLYGDVNWVEEWIKRCGIHDEFVNLVY
ncbi:MAG: ATP-binding cassette domain-containing protein [Methylococcales bacterium]|nr:ATP-binding cassette domain-containing protein [Methylococcales bacterium]